MWFRQQRELNIPVSGALLQGKTRMLYEQLSPDVTNSQQIHLSEQTFVRYVQKCLDNRGCTVYRQPSAIESLLVC